MSMLSFDQQRPLIRKELSRRIGYTNGLHDIYRFARVVNYLHSVAPASVTTLRQLIMDKEGIRGPKYADGVIDSARALDLIYKVGGQLTPSDKGYALYATQQMSGLNHTAEALLLNAVLECDGEATLNILDILSLGVPTESTGPMLMDRFLSIIDARERFARQSIESKVVRDSILQDLTESKERLASALDVDNKRARTWSTYREGLGMTAEQKINRFYEHTWKPRRGWLKDLGCIEETARNRFTVTERGRRLLTFFRQSSCYRNSIVLLPFSPQVSEILGAPEPIPTPDLYWRAVAAYFSNEPLPAQLSNHELYHWIKHIYPHVKLHLFNEATVESVYSVLAARLAVDGQHQQRQVFEEQLEWVSRTFPDEVYRLRQRYGGSGYITLRKL